ncbi:hypothetical protein nbrc107697_00660 [Gordonia crocea]|uniref:Cell filamentation protein Fic n=1 Tax=Gordonia crocea TaxID=589162 RepID=A0A7M4BQ66_9ACTN|nr:hypothetical protein nbrc107697_00660 [Gordonia crocea]
MKPWDTGDSERDWQGYFVPGTDVLRNLLGVTDPEDLADAENDLVEARTIELREAVWPLGPRTYSLGFLQAIHRYLFQDIYEGRASCARSD